MLPLGLVGGFHFRMIWDEELEEDIGSRGTEGSERTGENSKTMVCITHTVWPASPWIGDTSEVFWCLGIIWTLQSLLLLAQIDSLSAVTHWRGWCGYRWSRSWLHEPGAHQMKTVGFWPWLHTGSTASVVVSSVRDLQASCRPWIGMEDPHQRSPSY